LRRVAGSHGRYVATRTSSTSSSPASGKLGLSGFGLPLAFGPPSCSPRRTCIFSLRDPLHFGNLFPFPLSPTREPGFLGDLKSPSSSSLPIVGATKHGLPPLDQVVSGELEAEQSARAWKKACRSSTCLLLSSPSSSAICSRRYCKQAHALAQDAAPCPCLMVGPSFPALLHSSLSPLPVAFTALASRLFSSLPLAALPAALPAFSITSLFYRPLHSAAPASLFSLFTLSRRSPPPLSSSLATRAVL
jgi:hypothetical protein